MKDLTGLKFSRWTVLQFVEFRTRGNKRPHRHPYWKCRCECGTIANVGASRLRCGYSKSCGCLNREISRERTAKRFFKHGHAQRRGCSAEYKVWTEMISRCRNSNNTGWKDYGGRGITVCEDWRNDFKSF